MEAESKSVKYNKKARKNPVGIAQQEINRVQPSSRFIEMCESVALSLNKLGDSDQAGNWYEIAGQLILSEVGYPTTVRALRALPEYEKALECYNQTGDGELITKCTNVIFDLRRACASA
jgi:hypothetical protein